MAGAGEIVGTARDEAGGGVPGVTVELRNGGALSASTVTDRSGAYRLETSAGGSGELVFSLINFATVRREVSVPASGTVRVDPVLHLAFSADVLVTGMRTFANLADAPDPAQNLVGVAQSASQGAITARQLDTRPLMRTGEVLETVPGLIISQHSGEGKANQFYLRGFNLDHGTDFATTVAGMPVNLPTHAHGHGYTDLAFLIPELVSGVQFTKGPYFPEQGDFSTAGSATISYTNSLDRPIVLTSGGEEAFGRVLVAASPTLGTGKLLAAFEMAHNDGPWDLPENYRKVNALVRFTSGDVANGFSLTGMAYTGEWDASDQIPLRAVDGDLIGRFGAIDKTDGGESYRASGSFEWQRTRGNAATRLTAYGIAYDLDLYSNFTFFLDDPERGDQFHQADNRFISGARLSHHRQARWGDRLVQNTFGGQIRNDAIGAVGLYHTQARTRLERTRFSRRAARSSRRTRHSGARGYARSPARAWTCSDSMSTPTTR
jgi:hypothetical protein